MDLSKLSEEETKYLGGDMRFTHLVKGLDYALLHKVGAWGRAGVGGRAAVGPCGQCMVCKGGKAPKSRVWLCTLGKKRPKQRHTALGNAG